MGPEGRPDAAIAAAAAAALADVLRAVLGDVTMLEFGN